ncbi:putative oxidoreductase, SDR family [Nocardia nova SH22a]|uniref:Probable oxidoreductase n=2 Tax=Nocardia nova TaxID=37330 RepID=W5TIC6_9NOCA|nr:SDR family NAD(P)-dependent oxidoreductase [Nocardia nova]AHH16976.1 putative oxidoreductase, SDR family [Nocardia nova SH22a]
MGSIATHQRPIGSGYGRDTTSADVMAGVDLTGKVAVVTGGYSGLGLDTTKHLISAGAQVIIPARRPEMARAAVAEFSDQALVVDADLADLESVHRCATDLSSDIDRIDYLFATAGIMATPLRRVGPGRENQFAVNHLGHFALTAHLWPLLIRGRARVIVYSSAGHHYSGIRWNDLHFERGYDKWEAYGQAKTANILFAVQLDRIGAASGIRSFALHPGAILTPLQRHLGAEEMVERGWIDADGNPIDPTFKSVSQGAATGLWAATTPQLTDRGGVYLEDCDIADVATPDGNGGGVMPYAIDPAEASRLWAISAELTGVTVPGAGRER